MPARTHNAKHRGGLPINSFGQPAELAPCVVHNFCSFMSFHVANAWEEGDGRYVKDLGNALHQGRTVACAANSFQHQIYG
eukprot:1067539-Pelagomonas_calceolata.AAC.1